MELAEDFLRRLLLGRCLLTVLILIHIRHESRLVGEGWRHQILLEIFFPLLNYALWLLVWPGSLRYRLMGKRMQDENPMARSLRRLKQGPE